MGYKTKLHYPLITFLIQIKTAIFTCLTKNKNLHLNHTMTETGLKLKKITPTDTEKQDSFLLSC